MIDYTPEGLVLVGPEGRLLVPEQDDITPKLAMLFEAQCEGRRVIDTVKKFGFTKQRYYQLLHLFQEKGASVLYKIRNADPKVTTEERRKTSTRSSAIASSIPMPRQR